jgi:hypothetical protein
MNIHIDIKDGSIRCIADREGAEVFTSYANPAKPLRVLTFSQDQADALARNWQPEAADEPTLL